MADLLFGWIVSAISVAGYGGILGLMAAESACIPLPSEIIMPFAGYLVSTGRFSLLTVATMGAIGCNLGSTLAYLVGAYAGRPGLAKWGRYILLSEKELERLDGFFARFGGAAVLVGRLLPGVRTFISLPAGIAKMGFIRFQIYTFVGSWPWCFMLAYIGMILGENWNRNPILKAIFTRADWTVMALIAIGIGWYLYRAWRMSRGR